MEGRPHHGPMTDAAAPLRTIVQTALALAALLPLIIDAADSRSPPPASAGPSPSRVRMTRVMACRSSTTCCRGCAPPRTADDELLALDRDHGGRLTDPTPGDVALELERLRGVVEAGFARTDGSLALLVQRSDQTDNRLADHEQRLDALEKTRWPLPSIGALTAAAGLAVALWESVR